MRTICLEIVILLGLFLAACDRLPPAAPLTSQPANPATLVPVTPSARTPLPPPTRRAARPTDIPSATPAPSVTPLPPLPVYVFPLQPPSAASYSPGVTGHGYPATDLFAKPGTKFVAVTSGVVDFVSTTDEWQPDDPDPAKRSGLAVAIIGDDGVRYYGSHLSKLAPDIHVGLRVTPGQLLGYVGASGDARGKDPHLHFGISHPTTPDDWQVRRGELDPYPYLLAWEKGLNLSPRLP